MERNQFEDRTIEDAAKEAEALKRLGVTDSHMSRQQLDAHKAKLAAEVAKNAQAQGLFGSEPLGMEAKEREAYETLMEQKAEAERRFGDIKFKPLPKVTKEFMQLMREKNFDPKVLKQNEKEKTKELNAINTRRQQQIKQSYKDSVKQLDKKDPQYKQKLQEIKDERKMKLEMEKIIKAEQKQDLVRRTQYIAYAKNMHEAELKYPEGGSKQTEMIRQVQPVDVKGLSNQTMQQMRQFARKHPQAAQLANNHYETRTSIINSGEFDRAEFHKQLGAITMHDVTVTRDMMRQCTEVGTRRPATEIKAEMTTLKAAQKVAGDPAKQPKAPEKSKDLSK